LCGDETIFNAARAYDQDADPPATCAVMERIHFSGLRVPGLFWLHGFPAAPAGNITAIDLVFWSAALDPNNFDPEFNAFYNLTGATPAPVVGSPAGWTLFRNATGDYPLEKVVEPLSPTLDTTLVGVRTQIENTLYGFFVLAEALRIFDVYLEVEYTPASMTDFGYVIGRPTPAVACIQPLARAFFFNGVESDGVLKFIPLGQASVLTIPELDLGLVDDHAKISAQIAQEQELPAEVEVTYLDPALDYQQNKQAKRRDARTVRTRNQVVIEAPFVLSKDAAAQIAEKTLFLSYLERKQYQANLWKMAYSLLDPTDVVQFVYKGDTYQMRLVKTSLGAGYAVALSGVSEDPNTYLSAATGGINDGFVPGAVQELANTTLWLFDLPLLRDSDFSVSGSGLYFAVVGDAAGWPGAVLYGSADDAIFAALKSSGVAVHYGWADATLPAPTSPWAWDDDNELVVWMVSGTLAGSTEADVLAGPVNVLLVGEEVLQFVDCVQNPDGSYTLSHLLRGRRGTEAACDTHGANEEVWDLSAGGIVRQPLPLSHLSQLRYYRAVTIGQDITAVASETQTLAGNDLKPLSPVAIGGEADIDGNMVISWLRRTRAGGAYGTDGSPVDTTLIDCMGGPVNEQSEAYEVDIMDGATVARTIAGLTTPTAVYALDDQITDFGSPLPGSYDVKVYQMSAVVGRGFPGLGSVPAPTDAPAVYPGGGQFYINGA